MIGAEHVTCLNHDIVRVKFFDDRPIIKSPVREIVGVRLLWIDILPFGECLLQQYRMHRLSMLLRVADSEAEVVQWSIPIIGGRKGPLQLEATMLSIQDIYISFVYVWSCETEGGRARTPRRVGRVCIGGIACRNSVPA